MQRLGRLPDRTGPGQARGVSSDGDVVVGQFDSEAFRWTTAGGMVGLGFLPDGRASSMANDVSRDGNRIVGWSQAARGPQTAFLWTPDWGMRSLRQVLGADSELDLEGVELLTATSISDDGLVVAGSGRHDGRPITWIAELTEAPPAGPFQCYDVKTSRGAARFEPREVSLSDQFGDTVQIVKRGRQLCAPIDVQGAEASDPEAHLVCYDLVRPRGQRRRPRPEPVELRVSNPFGVDQPLRVRRPDRPKRLCVPSTVERVESGAAPGDPGELELDHFLCYAVRARSRDFNPIEFSLADLFQTSERLLKKPRWLCNPVDKNGEGILDPAAHLTCYDVRPLKGGHARRRLNRDVLASNPFAAEQPFMLKKPKTVCVSSRKSYLDDGPAACSAIEPGEFGDCRAIIGWGIDPVTGQCAGISGCGCDERCEGRVFPDERTCQQQCGGR
jgi:probable HAF family extracellular repeat protein